MKNRFIFAVGMAVALLLGVVGMLGVTNRASAQELVRATFTLSEETRFGATVLPAGQYTLFVEPITPLRAVGSPVAIAVRPENAARPYVAILATASEESCGKDELKLAANGAGFVAQSMCLGTQQLVLHFDGSHSGNSL